MQRLSIFLLAFLFIHILLKHPFVISRNFLQACQLNPGNVVPLKVIFIEISNDYVHFVPVALDII